MSSYLWSLLGCLGCFCIAPALVLWMDRRQAARALRQYLAIIALVFVLPVSLGASMALLI